MFNFLSSDEIKDNVSTYNPCMSDEISKALFNYNNKIQERDNRTLDRIKELSEEINNLIKTESEMPAKLLMEYEYLVMFLGK
jgi:hypothetical protein